LRRGVVAGCRSTQICQIEVMGHRPSVRKGCSTTAPRTEQAKDE
jgi:hypothetical protein